MKIALTPGRERFVSDRLESGHYVLVSEIVRVALQLLECGDRAAAHRTQR